MRMTSCTHKTQNGSKCQYTAVHIYEGRPLCGVHLNVVKANEECSICLCPMTTPTTRIKLDCGHYFHKGCLSRCPRVECPMCRAPITPVQAYEVFEPTRVRPIMLGTFTLPTEIQPIVMDTINAVNIGAASNPINAALQQIIMFRMAEATKRVSPQIIGQAIDMFEGALQHVMRYGTYEGFGAGGDEHGFVFGSDQEHGYGVNPGQAAAAAYSTNPTYEDESDDDDPSPRSQQLPSLRSLPSLSPLLLPAPAIPLPAPAALEAARHYTIDIAPVRIPVPVPVPVFNRD